MADISKLNSNTLVNTLKASESKKEMNPKEADAKVREVADLYEKYFVKEMMKNMRSTVQEGGFMKANNAEKIFQEQLDDQYSTEANKRGGFGLSDMIYQQLTEKFGAQLGLKGPPDKPQGPLSPEKQMKLKELISTPTPKPKQITYLVHPEPNAKEKNVNVQNPWAGVLQNKKMIEGEKTSYQIKHDNGLESLILTQGAPSSETRHLSPGDKLQAGQSLGLASNDTPLVWTVKSSVSE